MRIASLATATLLTLALTLPHAALAQQAHDQHAQHAAPAAAAPADAAADAAAKAAAHKKFQEESLPLRRALAADKAELAAVMAAQNPDPAKARALGEKIFDTEQKLQALADKHGMGGGMGCCCMGGGMGGGKGGCGMMGGHGDGKSGGKGGCGMMGGHGAKDGEDAAGGHAGHGKQ